ncbi:MAG: PQQ-binding-like beta-propeller repeat protein [Christensenellaceae bacterium]|jgi:outer membrane protein assembly factor BamB|nr:PQQ-binding-like beta-propeller repeat protein [Christensenellaceae bacterium]
MGIWPDNTCLMCDMPWKNNRVLYDGSPCCRGDGEESLACCLWLGALCLKMGADGRLRGEKLGESEPLFAFETGKRVRRGSMAADVLFKTLYFAAGDEILALDLESGEILWSLRLNGEAQSPMLFELAGPGGILPLLGAGDESGSFFAVCRESGETLWRAEIGFPIADVAAYAEGRLYISCTKLVACLDASSGDVIWFQNTEAERGILHDGYYLAGGKAFRASDGLSSP